MRAFAMTGIETLAMIAVDQVGVAHAGDAALGADVGGHSLERHDGDGAGVFGDLRLIGGDDVHDDAALEHLGEAALDAVGSQLGGGGSAAAALLEAGAVSRTLVSVMILRFYGGSVGSGSAGSHRDDGANPRDRGLRARGASGDRGRAGAAIRVGGCGWRRSRRAG